ncbi:MAG: hypothetical protein JWN04_5621 [Myxococcaceae bacterium]|nr:hypothetical protein [Myxococcaceae bacterium]
MSVSLLSVQFRNLLPSEELLLFARARWNDAQARGQVTSASGDATLCITQTASKLAAFEVRLTLAGSTLASVSHAESALLAVEGAFAQLGTHRQLAALEATHLAGTDAPSALTRVAL